MPTPDTRPAPGRVRPLDGLRGLAALVVVLYHCLLASSVFFASADSATSTLPMSSVTWLLTYTPLHVIWAGPEAVIVFFVLSGFVLSLPVARGGRLHVDAYYPSRLIRLYLPVWGALVVAGALHVLVSHAVVPGGSWWLNQHARPLELSALGPDASLTSRAGDWGFTSVLWSLRWEVLFSLLLPVLLALVARARRAWLAAIVLACLEALLFNGGSGYLIYLPPFLLGVVLAFERERIERLARTLREHTVRNAVVKLALAAVCVSALTADWWLTTTGVASALITVGACLSIVLALISEVFGRFLESTPMQWTGRRSYSLYLLHEPIVVALAFALGGRPMPVLFVLAAVPLSLAGAAVFYRLVESPAQLLAHRWSAYRARRNRAKITACYDVRAS
jgi:peptidoglycan/LPS O-acetylase OafA/YrhL